MNFTSGIFLYGFLPEALVLYYVTPARGRSWLLALVSYVFYGAWRPDFVLLLWLSTVVDFGCGRGIQASRERGRSGVGWVGLSCCVNLGLLAYFKYANFGVETLNAALAALGHAPVHWTSVVLPVGISFYTFQTLSYTIDVYRRDAEPVRSLGDFACYVAMFPQLVAGPIVRYRSIAEQLNHRVHSLDRFGLGVLSFQAGLAKNVLLADSFAGLADTAFGAPALGTLDAWVGAVAYTFQIYFDFSGYSDMAIGLGLMLGFRFPVNFDRPYTSRNVTEFWRRWHISLSSFLRDYLYVPLGGNRKGNARTGFNLLLTMLLGGLWHGAASTFIAWGAYHGLWLLVELLNGKRGLLAALPDWIQRAGTFVIIMVGWVLFRSESIGQGVTYLRAMFTPRLAGAPLVDLGAGHALAFAAASLVLWWTKTTQDHLRSPGRAWPLALQLLFLASLLELHRVANVPFLYFQF